MESKQQIEKYYSPFCKNTGSEEDFVVSVYSTNKMYFSARL